MNEPRYLRPRKDPERVEYYEGLVRKTASMYEGIVQEEYEDLCSILRIKCWRALESFDQSKSRVPIQNYVFSCVRNQVKDLLKRKRRNDLYIEDIAPGIEHGAPGSPANRDRFEMRYMKAEEDEAFAEILAETPLIPSTLNGPEQRVLTCLYLEYSHAEVSEALSLTPREVARAVRAIKDKLADWKPSAQRSNGAAPAIEEDDEVEPALEG